MSRFQNVWGPLLWYLFFRQTFRVFGLGCKHSLRYDGLAERDITFILFASQYRRDNSWHRVHDHCLDRAAADRRLIQKCDKIRLLKISSIFLKGSLGTAGLLVYFKRKKRQKVNANKPAEAHQREGYTDSRVKRRRQTGERYGSSEEPPSVKWQVCFIYSSDTPCKICLKRHSPQLTCSSVLPVSACSIWSKRLAVSPAVVSIYMTLCFRW